MELIEVRNLPTQEFPDLERLTAGLSAVFNREVSANRNVRVLDRKPNPEGSTFPTEIVTCSLDGRGSRLRLFVKYGTKEFDNLYRHRGDISYEAKVYRNILQPLRISTPTFYGVYRDEITRVPWLVLEYLEGTRGHWSRNPEAMISAAIWIGKFHAVNEERLLRPGLKFLQRYDRRYYMGWARRTNRLFSNLQTRFPWLRDPSLMSRLFSPHGEFIPSDKFKRMIKGLYSAGRRTGLV